MLARLAGHRLHRDDARLRLHLPVHHGGPLPQAHAPGPDGGAGPGRPGGVRADDPGQPGDPGRDDRLGGTAGTPVLRADLDSLTAVQTLLPAARAQRLQRLLPGLTSGEGVAETSFGGYRPVTGPPPARRRTLADPLNREEYMLQLAGRATAAPAEQAESSGAR